MKRSKPRQPRVTYNRPFGLHSFARFAGFLTIGVTVMALVIAASVGHPNAWIVAAVLCPITVVLIWIVLLSVGCLVMIPVGLWRLGKRLVREDQARTVPYSGLWDRWMDGPEPS